MKSKYAAFIMLPFGILGFLFGASLPFGLWWALRDAPEANMGMGVMGGIVVAVFCFIVSGLMVGDGWRGWKAWRADEERIALSDPYGGL